MSSTPPPRRVPVDRLPARIGLVLARPTQALQRIETQGGGVRDALWLVLLGTVCFRSEALARPLLGLSTASPFDVILRLLSVFATELRGAALVVLPAAVALTILAGRGRRDPSRDVELAAACYTPYFAVHATLRSLQLDLAFGPVPVWLRQAGFVCAVLGAGLVFGLALRLARTRKPETAPSVEPSHVPAHPRDLGARATVIALFVVLGLSLGGNLAWIIRHHETVAPVLRGQRAPDFRLPRVDGQGGSLALSDLKGQVVLLDFWATWCPPCLQMMPIVHELYDRYKDRGLAVVGVHAGDTPAGEIAEFLAAKPAPYPVVRDGDGGETAGRYKVMALPQFVLVGRDGTVVRTFWGLTSRSTLASAIQSALGQ